MTTQERQLMLTTAELDSLNREFDNRPVEDLLGWVWKRFGARASIGTSFQGAGLVTMHLSRTLQLPFPVFTLDTGLLFPETVELKQRLEQFFGVSIEALTPDLTVEQQAAAYGKELWNRDPDLCCTARKVIPLQSKLAQLDCWITGLRRQQSETRAQIDLIEVYALEEGAGREIVKLNPLAHWTRERIWKYIRDNQIPYNPLHDRGYHSIGCWPCTRQSAPAGGERAGRWVGFNKAECGIHTFLAKKG